MLFIPLLYFIALGVVFYVRNGKWNMDAAATSILVAISLCAIMIDKNNIYGNYGINQNFISTQGLLLFCLQWTVILIPIHLISMAKLEQPKPIKFSFLRLILLFLVINAFVLILFRLSDIKEALLLDMADVRKQHNADLMAGGEKGGGIVMIVLNTFTANPFPTLMLFFWFYLNAFTKTSFLFKTIVLLASIVQSAVAIIIAGRAAMVFWMFEFYVIYSYFYQYLPRKTKFRINISALSIMTLFVILITAITLARFDGKKSGRDPFDSIYGYAGQHIDNFCTMFENGADSPMQTARIFPLLSKVIAGIDFSLDGHYQNIRTHVKADVNVFDTFGAEIYLDLGWGGYLLFFFFWGLLTFYIYRNWKKMDFYRVFYIVIFIAFFVKGLFAWPFTTISSTLALIMMFFLSLLFKYRFVFK